MNRQNPRKSGGRSVLLTLIYVVGVTAAVGAYVFTQVTKQLIPGLSPLALAAVIGAYMYEHYQNGKQKQDGSLRSQMIILGILLAYCIVMGVLGIVGAVLQSRS